MKRLILLALFAVGCGSSLPDGETTWNVTLGNWEAPTCEGVMSLSPEASQDTNVSKFAGSWSCGTFGVAVGGFTRPDGRVDLSFETTPGFFNGMRGILADDDAIAGDILIAGQQVAFAAYRQ